MEIKALLIIITMIGNGGHGSNPRMLQQSVTPMPSIASCESAGRSAENAIRPHIRGWNYNPTVTAHCIPVP